MKRFKNLTLSLAAGLLGGVLAHYVIPASVHAQNQSTIPREIRAQRFVLMNEKGEVGGVLGFDNDGKPAIALYSDGRQIWIAGGKPIRPLGK